MADEVEDKIEKRWAEMNAAWDAEIAIEEERDLLRVEVAQAIAALTEIAAFGDDSYAAFDEPGSARIAREALAKIIRVSLPPTSSNLGHG